MDPKLQPAPPGRFPRPEPVGRGRDECRITAKCYPVPEASTSGYVTSVNRVAAEVKVDL